MAKPAQLRRRGSYGIDAPYAPAFMGLMIAVVIVMAIIWKEFRNGLSGFCSPALTWVQAATDAMVKSSVALSNVIVISVVSQTAASCTLVRA